MKRFNIIIILLLASALYAKAQENYVSVQYSVGVPFGELQEYTDKTSFRGLTIDYTSMLTENLGFGVEGGWNTFYEEKGFSTVTDGTESLSGYEFRYSNNVPLMVSGTYFFMPDGVLSPYASLGAGTVYTKRDTDIGSVRFSNDTWHFALQPEVGLIYQFTQRFGAKLSANYNYMFENDDLERQSYLGVNLGVVFMKR